MINFKWKQLQTPTTDGEAYEYSLFSTHRREIRLLKIRSATQSKAPITCSLQLASLDDVPFPKYAALSYCWGKGPADQPIYCDSSVIPVTDELLHALRSLRKLTRGYVWIDQICIYQDRYRTKCCRNLRFDPLFCEGVGFAHLACRIGKFTLRVFIYLHLTIPPPRRLTCSSSQYDHESLLETARFSLPPASPIGGGTAQKSNIIHR